MRAGAYLKPLKQVAELYLVVPSIIWGGSFIKILFIKHAKLKAHSESYEIWFYLYKYIPSKQIQRTDRNMGY